MKTIKVPRFILTHSVLGMDSMTLVTVELPVTRVYRLLTWICRIIILAIDKLDSGRLYELHYAVWQMRSNKDFWAYRLERKLSVFGWVDLILATPAILAMLKAIL